MDWDIIKATKCVKEVRDSGTVGTDAVVVAVGSGIEALKVRNNNDDAKTVLVSFDGGTDWFETPTGSELEFGASDLLSIKGSAAGTKYEIFYLKRQ